MDSFALGVAGIAVGAAALALLSEASCAQSALSATRRHETAHDCGSVAIVKCAPQSDPAAQAPEQRSRARAREDLAVRRRGDPQWLDEIVIESERRPKPTLSEAFERNFPPPVAGIVRYETEQMGDGSACTRVLPYGYTECSKSGNRRTDFGPISR